MKLQATAPIILKVLALFASAILCFVSPFAHADNNEPPPRQPFRPRLVVNNPYFEQLKFDPQTAEPERFRRYLTDNMSEFISRFNTLRAIATAMPPERKALIESIMLDGVKIFFLGDVEKGSSPGDDAYKSYTAPEILGYYLDHANSVEGASFVPAVAHEMMQANTPDNTYIIAALAKEIVTDQITNIVLDNRGVSENLLSVVVTNANVTNEAAFYFLDVLYPIWQSQGRLRDEGIHQKLVAQYASLFTRWQDTFTAEIWASTKWALRLKMYDELAGQPQTLAARVQVLTSKFAIEPSKNLGMRKINEKSLIDVLNYLSFENGDSELTVLMAVVKEYLASPAQRSFGYPDFENELASRLIKVIGTDITDAQNLLGVVLTSLEYRTSFSAQFLTRLKPILSRGENAHQDFDQLYAKELAYFLSKMSARKRGVEYNGGNTPEHLIEYDEQMAIAYYKEFRRRASPQQRYVFLEKELGSFGQRQIEGEYPAMLKADLDRFRGYGPFSDKPQPKLRVYTNCLDAILN